MNKSTESGKLLINETLLSVDGGLVFVEAGLKPTDMDQMSGYKELMSGDTALLPFEYVLKAMETSLKTINNKHESIEPDQLSRFKALKPCDETQKPFDEALKSSAPLFGNPMHICVSTGHTLYTTAVVFDLNKSQ